jgi:hypothetical protein
MVGGISIPLPDRLHGYNLGKSEVELRLDQLHYRLQTVTSAVTKGLASRNPFSHVR